MNDKIAIDVVLLPSVETADWVIGLNRRLLETTADKIVLNRIDCVPHISLAMGCIERKDIGAISEILEDIAGKLNKGELKFTNINIETNSAGQKISGLLIEKTEQLQLLHETVLEKLSPYFSYDVSEEMVLAGKVNSTTLSWIRNYRHQSSFENFSPHVTIGYGEIEGCGFLSVFNVASLGLFHLGNHCTCRKILFATRAICR